MTTQIHEFNPEIYPRRLWVTVGAPYAVIKDMFEDVLPMEASTDAQVDNTRRTKPDVKGGILIRFENHKAMTAANIAHEAVHAAMEIFGYVDAYPDLKNQEPFAYLVGWIVRCIDEVKNYKNKPIKSKSNE